MNYRFALGCLILAVGFAPALSGQSAPPAAPRAFEVASIRPHAPGDLNSAFDMQPGGLLNVSNATAFNLIRNAWQLQPAQIAGAPGWMQSERFDVTARASGPAGRDQMAAMLRTLLIERFKLVVRLEPRELDVFALTLARSDGRLGPKLRPAEVDCAALRERGDGPPPTGPDGQQLCRGRSRPGEIAASGVTLTDLAQNISNQAGRFVVDRTGLKGYFDLAITWAPEQPLAANAPPRPSIDGPSFRTALEEQLGLKLESQRAPIDHLVIVAAEKPVEN